MPRKTPSTVTIPADADALLSRAQAAAFYGVSIATLSRLAKAGKGPRYAWVGGQARYRRQSLIEWQAAQEHDPAAMQRGRQRAACEAVAP